MAVDGDEDDVEAQMAAIMGFQGFGTTKQKKVRGNDVGAIAKNKVTEYRQYMYVYQFYGSCGVDANGYRNRPGGFNRALSPS
jgi:U4/U6.U5 tri-snRNP-associated protein 3